VSSAELPSGSGTPELPPPELLPPQAANVSAIKIVIIFIFTAITSARADELLYKAKTTMTLYMQNVQCQLT
jgi:hypothetical protein